MTDIDPMVVSKVPLSPQWRRALELLADAAERGGTTKSVLLARGLTVEMVDSIALCGLAATSAETIKAGGRSIDVVRVRITDAGRYQLMSQDRTTAEGQARARNDHKK